MPRTKGGFGAIGLALLLLGGCASTDLFSLSFLQSAAPNGDQVIYADLEAVSRSAQGALSGLGLTAVVNRKGESVNISSTTKGGAKFTLVLTREKSATGEQTRMHIDWENGKDEAFVFDLFAKVALQHKR